MLAVLQRVTNGIQVIKIVGRPVVARQMNGVVEVSQALNGQHLEDQAQIGVLVVEARITGIKEAVAVLLDNKVEVKVRNRQKISSIHVHIIKTHIQITSSHLLTLSDNKDIETEIDNENEINHKARSLSPSSFTSQGSYSKPGLFGQSQGSWNYQSGTLVILYKKMAILV